MYATPYRVAVDMWELDAERMERLRKHGIENSRVDKAHNTAKIHIEEAQKYLQRRQYDKFFTAARSAWSFESRAYPDVRGTADDVIKGILFYLALLLPFAFFAERLPDPAFAMPGWRCFGRGMGRGRRWRQRRGRGGGGGRGRGRMPQ